MARVSFLKYLRGRDEREGGEDESDGLASIVVVRVYTTHSVSFSTGQSARS
jgi:hypothetical protein